MPVATAPRPQGEERSARRTNPFWMRLGGGRREPAAAPRPQPQLRGAPVAVI